MAPALTLAPRPSKVFPFNCQTGSGYADRSGKNLANVCPLLNGTQQIVEPPALRWEA
jgi:hypothetical protein